MLPNNAREQRFEPNEPACVTRLATSSIWLCVRSFSAFAAILASVSLQPWMVAHAQPLPTSVTPSGPNISVTWEAPSPCPDGAAVRARVLSLFVAGDFDDSKLNAVGRVQARGAEFKLSLELQTSAGKKAKRNLSATTCSALTDAAALVIALAYDPTRVRFKPDEPPQAVPTTPKVVNPPAAPSPTTPPQPTPRPAQRPTRLPRADQSADQGMAKGLGPGVHFALDVGALPGVSPGLVAELTLALDAFRIAPQFLVFPSSSESLEGGAGAKFSLIGGGILGCRNIVPIGARTEINAGDPTLLGCIALELGEMRAKGFGLGKVNDTGAFWAAGRAELRFEIALGGPISAGIGAGLLVPFRPQNFVIQRPAPDSIVHAPSSVGGRFDLGISAIF